ncbi:MAG: hypothetical protein ACOZAJ_00975 [Patescibacteria group bacterium]
MNLKKIFVPLLIVLFVAFLSVPIQATTNNINSSNALTMAADDHAPPTMLTADSNQLEEAQVNGAVMLQLDNNEAVQNGSNQVNLTANYNQVSYNNNPAQSEENTLNNNNNEAAVQNSNISAVNYVSYNSAQATNNMLNDNNNVALEADNNNLMMNFNNALGNEQNNAVNNSNRLVSWEVAQSWYDSYNLDLQISSGLNAAGNTNTNMKRLT